MSFSDEVISVLRQGNPDAPVGPDQTPEWGEANRDLYLMSVDRATVAIKNAVLLMAHEIDRLHREIDDLRTGAAD